MHTTQDRPAEHDLASRTRIKGQSVALTWLDPTVLPDRDSIFAVSVVPITDDGRVVLARLRRGPEIPGGGMEDLDANPEQTARREAWEEARILLGELTPIQVIRMERTGSDQPAEHIVIYAGRVSHLPHFIAQCESTERLVVDQTAFVDLFQVGTPQDRRRLLNQAFTAVGHTAPTQAVAA